MTGSPAAQGGAHTGGDATDEVVDVAIIGAGPGGLSAALNLVRARRSVLLIDSNRPRNAATFHSHGFITRDGVSPLELRRLGREELAAYPGYRFEQAVVRSISRIGEGADDSADYSDDDSPDRSPDDSAAGSADRGLGTATGFEIVAKAGLTTIRSIARSVVIATGVTETMPELPGIRAFYGTSIHSCVECDGWEHRGEPIAVIGETDDLAERGMLVSQWSDDVIVFTGGVGQVSDEDEADLLRRGVRVDRRPLADVEGDRTGLTGIRTADGDVVPRSAAFVRPVYTPAIGYTAGLDLALDALGFIEVDADGRTSADSVYAVGDATVSGPRQLIVSAGQGARVASTVNRDLLRSSASFARPGLVAFEDASRMR